MAADRKARKAEAEAFTAAVDAASAQADAEFMRARAAFEFAAPRRKLRKPPEGRAVSWRRS